MTSYEVLGPFQGHLIDTDDPVADRTSRSAAKGVYIGPGLVEVIAREDDFLIRQPNVELVGRFAGSADKVYGCLLYTSDAADE